MRVLLLKCMYGFILAAIALSSCMVADKSKSTTVKNIEELVTEKIAIDADKEQVIAFLESIEIEHSEYIEKDQVIYGIIRNTSRQFAITSSIQLVFYFDKQGRLTQWEAKEVYTGP